VIDGPRCGFRNPSLEGEGVTECLRCEVHQSPHIGLVGRSRWVHEGSPAPDRWTGPGEVIPVGFEHRGRPVEDALLLIAVQEELEHLWDAGP
jgi:hypothetical protein